MAETPSKIEDLEKGLLVVEAGLDDLDALGGGLLRVVAVGIAGDGADVPAGSLLHDVDEGGCRWLLSRRWSCWTLR